jgi:hypothetical protein
MSFAGAVVRGTTAGLAAGFIRSRMQNGSQEIWSIEIKGTALSASAEVVHGRTSYVLSVVADAQWAEVGRYRQYPALLAASQVWQRYLRVSDVLAVGEHITHTSTRIRPSRLAARRRR